MRTGIIATGLAGLDELRDLLPVLHERSPDMELHVFTDSLNDIIPGGKMQVHITGNPVSSLLSRRWWLDMKLPSVLKAYRPDVLLCLSGDCCLRTKIPQVLFINELRALYEPKQFSKTELLYQKFYLPRSIEKANAVITPSFHIKADLIAHFKASDEKVLVVPPYIKPLFTVLDWDQSGEVKNRFTGGREFFVSHAAAGSLIKLLKAFSQFKKWQRSDMKLVLTGKPGDDIQAKLQTYKYRNDVLVLSDLAPGEYAALLGASYAFIHFPVYEGSGVKVLEAMHSGTPVIASGVAGIKEMAGDAVLYADADNEAMLGAQMINLHKDEMLRSHLVAAGKKHAERYSAGSVIDALWAVLKESATQNAAG